MKSKKIKVLIELDSNWLDMDEDNPLFMFSNIIRDRVDQQVRDAIVEQAISKMKLPEIKVTPEQVKDRMLTILAERAINKD